MKRTDRFCRASSDLVRSFVPGLQTEAAYSSFDLTNVLYEVVLNMKVLEKKVMFKITEHPVSTVNYVRNVQVPGKTAN